MPSIVYGILGLGFLVHGADLGRVVLAGGLILTLLVLPTIIIAAREAMRAVPRRSGSGPSRSARRSGRSSARQVLPAAIPGIATGSILALSRAIGETAPLLMIGALLYAPKDPTLLSGFVALPGADLQLDPPAAGRVPAASPRRGSSCCSCCCSR